jgi:hypothetical protein
MMNFNDINFPQSILAAVKECEDLGIDNFLKMHGYKPSKNYFLELKGKLYPSKAIVGVAYGYEFPDKGPLKASDFSGGELTVKHKLEALGFSVQVLKPPEMVPVTGYWTFMCNPAKWQLDRFLEENIQYDVWHFNKWFLQDYKPGQLGVIRIGHDNRTKSQLQNHPRLERGVYAIVEIISHPHKRNDPPDKFWLKWGADDQERPVVDVKYIVNLLKQPILLSEIENDPDIKTDRYLIRGFEAVSMPLNELAFTRLLDLVNGKGITAINYHQEPIETTENIRSLEQKYRDATPEIKEVIGRRIERGTLANKVKRLVGYKCLVCEALGQDPYSFKKKNGEPYVEAHHIIPVSSLIKGSLNYSNIITVCANHHRQLHFGDCEVLLESTDGFTIRLDGGQIFIAKIQLTT